MLDHTNSAVGSPGAFVNCLLSQDLFEEDKYIILNNGLQDKVEGYKRQVDELTQQVEQLLAEKVGRARAAPAPQQLLCIEEPGSRPLTSDSASASCSSCSDHLLDLSDVRMPLTPFWN